jgi:hypothetical protein
MSSQLLAFGSSDYRRTQEEGKMNKASLGFLGIVTLGLLVTCCSDPMGTALERELVPGMIDGRGGDNPRITPNVNETSVTIAVVTMGDACYEQGELRVSVSWENRTVSVSPFDWVSYNQDCPTFHLTFTHSITVDLEEAGLWTVVVIGQDVNHESVQFEYSPDLGNEGLPPAL